jgi:hypothetical protein
MSGDKKKKAGFGKRGQTSVEPAEPTVSTTQRLREIGGRWLRASGLQKKKDSHAKAFKRTRSRP